jgi:hypothetical protein
MGIVVLEDLVSYSLGDLSSTMTYIDYHSPSAGVQITVPLIILDPDPLGLNSLGQWACENSRKDVAR